MDMRIISPILPRAASDEKKKSERVPCEGCHRRVAIGIYLAGICYLFFYAWAILEMRNRKE